MKNLNYQTLKEVNYDGYILENAPERVLQFGEGNFLRAFVDYFIDMMNEKANFNSKVVICQPIAKGLTDMINSQQGLYTLYLRGSEKGQRINKKRVISSVNRCINPYQNFNELLDCAKNPELRFIACNTTEAGIMYDDSCKFNDCPASSYPAKLTQFLYKRFEIFGKQKGKGFIVLSCELIDNNGKELEKCVMQYADLWNLSQQFKDWIKEENIFCSTLVDRIVTGYPRNQADEINKENGYIDNLIDTGEVFGFWVIEGPDSIKEELPFEKAGLPIIVCADHSPYKKRKVRILNGAHTSLIMGAYLSGQDIVRDCMNDEILCNFMNKTIYDEIIPTLTLPKNELEEFASSVTDRFKNPFIDHQLLSIALNSTSKWKARLLPTFKDYIKIFNKLPLNITSSFAFYLLFYRCVERKDDDTLIGQRNGKPYEIKDDRAVIDFFFAHKDDDTQTYVNAVAKNVDFWGEDLSTINNFVSTIIDIINKIDKIGVIKYIQELK